jgi:hypothetical protein
MVNKLTNVLVHVECFHIFEGDLTSNVVFNQLFIHPQRSATYNHTKPEIATSKLIGFKRSHNKCQCGNIWNAIMCWQWLSWEIKDINTGFERKFLENIHLGRKIDGGWRGG